CAGVLTIAISFVAPVNARGDTDYDCLLEPRMVIKLGSQLTGVLATVDVDRGDAVKAGEVMATLESALEARNLAIAEVKAGNDTEVRLAEQTVILDGAKHDRREILFKTRTVSEEAYEKAKIDAEMRKIELQRAKFALESARLELDRARTMLDMRRIRSPVDGVVIARKMSPGEFVREESSIMEIAAIDPLYVNVFMPVATFAKIRLGATGMVALEESGGGTHRAKVTVKDPVVDTASSTFM